MQQTQQPQQPSHPADRHAPAFWKSITRGDQITLSDEVTLMARMAAGRGPTPEQFEVKEIIDIVPRANICAWRFFSIDKRRYLVAKIVDEVVELHSYVEAADWDPQTRKELCDAGVTFLFQEPANPKDFDPAELKYTVEIPHEIGDKKYTYTQKGQGELHGEATYNPVRSGIAHQIATVVEYQTADKDVEPEMMILEIGSRTAGLVKLLTGRPLQSNDVVATPRR